MKMIASTKMVKAQRAMGAGKSYGEANIGSSPSWANPLRVPFAHMLCLLIIEIFKTASPKEPPKRKLFVVVSSDKGLCGGIHSSLSKLLRKALIGPEAHADPASPIVVIGDKAKAQLSRHLAKNFVLTVNQIGKDVPTFADAAGVVDLIAQSGVQYDSVRPP